MTGHTKAGEIRYRAYTNVFDSAFNNSQLKETGRILFRPTDVSKRFRTF